MADLVRRSGRRVGVDAVRGAAIVLMVLDHVLVQIDPGSLVRFTVTRLSLPLFMFAAASVWRRLTVRRFVVLVGVACAEWVLGGALGMARPGIVAVLVLVLVLVDVLARCGLDCSPVLCGSVGFLAAASLPIGWAGYEPGWVLGWFMFGRAAMSELEPWAGRWPSWLAAVGRRPVAWYLGHLGALVVGVEIF